jgi:hypothetical protein
LGGAPMSEKLTAEGWGIVRRGERHAHYYRYEAALCRKVYLYRAALFSYTIAGCEACAEKLRKPRRNPLTSE